jgi:hypothetical protein
MAHYAKIGLNNKVIQVVPFDDNKILNANGVEQEEVGRQILENETGWPLWIKCSIGTFENKHYTFNSDGSRSLSTDQSKAFRGNFPALGSLWDEENNIFFPVKNYPSWQKDTLNCKWQAPVPYPSVTTFVENEITFEYDIFWNEEQQRWESKTGKSNSGIDKYWNSSTLSWSNI